MYLRPAFRAGIGCGNVREEEDVAADIQVQREEEDLISVFLNALSARYFRRRPAWPPGG